MTTMREILEANGGERLGALLERLEAVTKTGIRLQVLPGGAGGGKERATSGQVSAASAAPPSPPKQAGREMGKAGVEIGKTIEKNGLRLHRYSSALRVTDLTNAGKRGKTVDEFALYNLDWVFDLDAADLLERALAGIAKASSYAQAAKIAKDAVRDMRKLGGSHGSHAVDVEENKHRGIDVEAPAGRAGAKIRIATKEFDLEASARDFSVRQRAKGMEDTSNHIPPVHGAKKTAITRFYAWVQANEKVIRRWSYHELLQAMGEAGLDYHSYSTYD